MPVSIDATKGIYQGQLEKIEENNVIDKKRRGYFRGC